MPSQRRSAGVAVPGFLIASAAMIWGILLRNPAGIALGAVGVAFSCAAFVQSQRQNSRVQAGAISVSADPVSAKVRVPAGPTVFGGWKGMLTVAGEVLRVVSDDGRNRLEIDCGQVERYCFNSNNGVLALRLSDDRRLYLQMSGWLLSADRSVAGRQATLRVKQLIAAHGRHSLKI